MSSDTYFAPLYGHPVNLKNHLEITFTDMHDFAFIMISKGGINHSKAIPLGRNFINFLAYHPDWIGCFSKFIEFLFTRIEELREESIVKSTIYEIDKKTKDHYDYVFGEGVYDKGVECRVKLGEIADKVSKDLQIEI